MDYKDLTYLTAIEKYQSMTKAAEFLHVSQPTLSKCLKNIENAVGLKLFHQSGHRMLPTFEGECYLRHAHVILQQKEEMDKEMQDFRENSISRIRIGLPAMRCTNVLSAVLPDYRRRNPNVLVEVAEGSSEDLDQLLLNGEIDAAFYSVVRSEQKDYLKYEHIREEELLLCAPKDHPIKDKAVINDKGKAELDLKDITNEQVILMKKGQRTRSVVDQILKEESIVLKDVLEIGNLHTIISLVANGYGLSFVFDSHLKPFSDDIDCYTIRNHKVFAEFTVAYKKTSYISKYLGDFITMTKQQYQED